MKNNKYLSGGIITVMTLCAVLAANSFAIPSVLAEMPKATEVRTITATPITASTNSSLQATSSDVTPDVNAVSEEKAITSAINGLAQFQYAADFTKVPHTVQYIKGVAPANSPLWIVVFTTGKSEAGVRTVPIAKEFLDRNIPPLEKYGSDAKIDLQNGTVTYNAPAVTAGIVAAVDALTGEYVNSTEFYNDLEKVLSPDLLKTWLNTTHTNH